MATKLNNKITQLTAAIAFMVIALMAVGSMQPAGAAPSGPFNPTFDLGLNLDLDPVLPDFVPTGSVTVDCSAPNKVVASVSNLSNTEVNGAVYVDGDPSGLFVVPAFGSESISLGFTEDQTSVVSLAVGGHGTIFTESVTLNCLPFLSVDLDLGIDLLPLDPGIFEPVDPTPAPTPEPDPIPDPAPAPTVEPAPAAPADEPAPAADPVVEPTPVADPAVDDSTDTDETDVDDDDGAADGTADADEDTDATDDDANATDDEATTDTVDETTVEQSDKTTEQAAGVDVAVTGSGGNTAAFVIIGLMALGLATAGGFAYYTKNNEGAAL